ncbi:Crp/Fnr family transcriptional regulator [Sandaracinobacter neustonicus]|uniref:Crp/Fnr family transcriptional regulator n=1 Tax=Sandaracinobacter neustonicus TaxID=1715348 RepID=UPI001F2BCA1D|nr:Crp/Fnr family transcriptional regulator [Sandaracinobacter neustonicus]
MRNRAICAALEPEDRHALGREGRIQTVPRGRTLVWEGEDAMLVANVIEGVLKLSTSTSDGREQIVGVVYPSDFIGRPFGERSQHSVTALVDSRVCLLPRAAFDRFAHEHPELEHRLLNRALDELDRARRWMLLLGRKSATERVASFLLELSHRLAESGCAGDVALDSFELPLDRQQIADVLGLTIETVSRQMSSLRAAGVIELPGRRSLHILDRARLTALAGD